MASTAPSGRTTRTGRVLIGDREIQGPTTTLKMETLLGTGATQSGQKHAVDCNAMTASPRDQAPTFFAAVAQEPPSWDVPTGLANFDLGLVLTAEPICEFGLNCVDDNGQPVYPTPDVPSEACQDTAVWKQFHKINKIPYTFQRQVCT